MDKPVDPATERFKQDIWQVLAHMLANNLIWIAVLVAVCGIGLIVSVPGRWFGRTLVVSGIALVALALLLHGVAWTPLL